MNSPFQAQPCNSPKSPTAETTLPQQTDMTSTPTQKTNHNLIKKVPTQPSKSPNMVTTNAKHLTHIDYSQSHNNKSSLTPLRRSIRLYDKTRDVVTDNQKLTPIGSPPTSASTNLTSSISTPKKIRTLRDLYDHTEKIDALIA